MFLTLKAVFSLRILAILEWLGKSWKRLFGVVAGSRAGRGLAGATGLLGGAGVGTLAALGKGIEQGLRF